jgi:two-component system, OmpR family, response regulator
VRTESGIEQRQGLAVLVVEDDKKLGPLIERGLARVGFAPSLLGTGRDALEAALGQRISAIVLDIALPDMSGLDVCRILRERGDATSILMLTAASTVSDRVLGLNTGADDYMVKPFAFDELVARLDALVRRHRTTTSSNVVAVGDLEVDPGRTEVRRAGTVIPLRPQEFRVLMVLASHAGTTVSQRTLTSEAWDWAFEPASNVLEVYIANLRAKIDRPYGRHSLRTIRGFGYMLTDD